MPLSQTDCVERVKRAVRAEAVHLCWPQPGIMAAIKEREEAKKVLAELPTLGLSSHPYYASVDDGQSGFVLAAHLSAEQMKAVPLHVAYEMLDDLATNSGGVNPDSPQDYRRNQVLSSYGPELAELVCQGIDEAMASRAEGYKRLRDYNGKLAPLSSTEMDEPCYDDCGPDDEHASATTSFDFWDAIEAARELIEQRDKAAASVRRGASGDTQPGDPQ